MYLLYNVKCSAENSKKKHKKTLVNVDTLKILSQISDVQPWSLMIITTIILLMEDDTKFTKQRKK